MVVKAGRQWRQSQQSIDVLKRHTLLEGRKLEAAYERDKLLVGRRFPELTIGATGVELK